MIGYLAGKLHYQLAPEIVLLVNGVGYELEASMQTHYRLPAVGESLELFTHLSIREDMHKLYGFITREERTLFRTLIKVNGIGPKLALQILSSLTPDEFMTHIQKEDVISLTKLPGIGKKTAERLVIEVKDKLGDLIECVAAQPLEQQTHDDAVNALISLGYSMPDIRAQLKNVDTTDLSTQAIIREALKLFTRMDS